MSGTLTAWSRTPTWSSPTAVSRHTQDLTPRRFATGRPRSQKTARSSPGSPGCLRSKQQPNLVFAAARWHGVTAPGTVLARDALLADDGAIRSTILARATQTNEVGRLATLLPVFGQFSGPLALIEVGASAGLCLYPDRWGYAWSTALGEVRLGDAPRLSCQVMGPAPYRPNCRPSPGAPASICIRCTSVT